MVQSGLLLVINGVVTVQKPYKWTHNPTYNSLGSTCIGGMIKTFQMRTPYQQEWSPRNDLMFITAPFPTHLSYISIACLHFLSECCNLHPYHLHTCCCSVTYVPSIHPTTFHKYSRSPVLNKMIDFWRVKLMLRIELNYQMYHRIRIHMQHICIKHVSNQYIMEPIASYIDISVTL